MRILEESIKVSAAIPLTRIVCKNTKDFRKEIAINKNKNLFQSDAPSHPSQCLSENYPTQDAQTKHCVFHIETDFDPRQRLC